LLALKVQPCSDEAGEDRDFSKVAGCRPERPAFVVLEVGKRLKAFVMDVYRII
jgi:hypothetical protein